MGLIQWFRNFFPQAGEPVLPHTHTWQKIEETFGAPRRDISPADFTENSTLNAALLGKTTFLFECPICFARQREEVFGSPNPQLDDMLDKVELYGPQYMQRNGVVFLFQRYQNPQTTTLPIR